MAVFPEDVKVRFEKWLRAAEQRLQRLEQRTLVLDPGNLVVAYTGTIPGSYTSGQPTVVLAGSGVTIGPLPCLSSYTPHANDVVMVLPLGASYVIAGTYS